MLNTKTFFEIPCRYAIKYNKIHGDNYDYSLWLPGGYAII